MKNITLFAALILTANATPVHAESGENRSAVAYTDLNLATPTGLDTLDKRIDKAARKVCRAGPTRSIRSVQQARECMEEAKARIVPMREILIAKARKNQPSSTLAKVRR